EISGNSLSTPSSLPRIIALPATTRNLSEGLQTPQRKKSHPSIGSSSNKISCQFKLFNQTQRSQQDFFSKEFKYSQELRPNVLPQSQPNEKVRNPSKGECKEISKRKNPSLRRKK